MAWCGLRPRIRSAQIPYGGGAGVWTQEEEGVVVSGASSLVSDAQAFRVKALGNTWNRIQPSGGLKTEEESKTDAETDAPLVRPSVLPQD